MFEVSLAKKKKKFREVGVAVTLRVCKKENKL